MAVMLNTRRPIGEPGEEQALGWRISGHGDDALIFHDGATWGFASDMAWDPRDALALSFYRISYRMSVILLGTCSVQSSRQQNLYR